MKYQVCILAFIYIAIYNIDSLPLVKNNNTSSFVQSAYAKVTKWGVNPTAIAISEGRSNNGQTLFSQRSDVNIINGQNIKKKPEMTYHYSMLKSNRPTILSRVGQRGQERLPAQGIVTQAEKRYNPKPYFDYSPIPPKDNKVPQSIKGSGDSEGPPSVVYGTPFDSFPSFPKPIAPPKTIVDIKPSVNLYNSPYDSYNPPSPNVDVDAKPAPGPIYPPNDMPPAPPYLSPTNTYLPANKPKLVMPAMSVMMKKPTGMENMDSYHGPYAPPMDSDDHAPKDHGGDDSSSDEGPPIVKTVDAPMEPDQPYYDHPPKDFYHHHHHHHQDMGDMGDMGMSAGGDDDMLPTAEDMEDHAAPSAPADDGSSDLSPPPSGDGGNGNGASQNGGSLPIMPKLPDYMNHDPSTHGAGNNYHGYQFDHHNHYKAQPPIHHVYHEVHTTTTTEAPVDERVNKGHYSYYYLGRKLWYIPLYFSVYFILYITALILKSIARHKVNLVHEYPKDKGRSFIDDGRHDIDDIQRKVARAVDEGAQKYAM